MLALTLTACRSALPADCEPLDELLRDLQTVQARHWPALEPARAQELWPRPLRSHEEAKMFHPDQTPYCANAWHASTAADLGDVQDCAVTLQFRPNDDCAVRLARITVERRFATAAEALSAMDLVARTLVPPGTPRDLDEPDHREYSWTDEPRHVEHGVELWLRGEVLHAVLTQQQR
jgi:hypothetical protein